MVNKINISNVIKFPSPFERLKSYTSSPDVILRKAIITQAIIDATNISELRVAKKLELEAKSWIFGGSESFKTTCMEGEIEPAFVVKVTKEIIELHKSKSNFRKQSQQKSVNSKKSLFKTKL
ncbi:MULTISPECIES: hypothetical protein [unclassified Candidatus Tisiphia]|jgi:hypothetical protein|uniref:hypothetical protein n=1 Tax=unclassified Candidatus Tisiphia TaxID=2996318 RepID=UPI00312C987C